MSLQTPEQLTHAHTFGQDRKRAGETRSIIVIGITATMMVVEIAAGIAYGSMALLADGLHMASHACALGITVFAYVYARRHAADPRFSFGTGKVNALGGFSGAILLACFSAIMAYESVVRLLNPQAIAFDQAIGVALVGLAVNGLSAFILGRSDHGHDHGHAHGHGHGHHHHRHDHDHGHHDHDHEPPSGREDHNLRSAYLHVLADALTSITAIAALLAAKYFGWIWMDPLMGIAGSVLVASWAFGLIRSTSATLLDHQAPAAALEASRAAIESDGDARVCDLHLWSIGPGIYNATISVAASAPRDVAYYRRRLPADLGIEHATIEIHALEPGPAAEARAARADPPRA